jgi:hypothetical protein
MKKVYFTILALSFFAFFTSCDLLKKNDSLTSAEIVEGLKTALNLGTDSSSTTLSKLDGYYGNKALKIMLPPEAQTMLAYTNNPTLKSILDNLGFNDQIETVVKSINRSAEKAALEAAPIFKKAITNLSITDGLSILNGKNPTTTKAGMEASSFDSLAATNYLKSQTITDLTTAFSAPINANLDKDVLGLGFTTNKAWTTLTDLYNQGVEGYNLLSGTKMEKVKATSLGVYCTQKALDGLFLKVGDEEKKIRKSPYDWAIDIIRKVFGSVSK